MRRSHFAMPTVLGRLGRLAALSAGLLLAAPALAAPPVAVDDAFPMPGTTTLNATNDFLVATESDELQQNPRITALPNGNFVVVFQDYSEALDSDGWGILARIFAPDGDPVGPDFLVNQTTGSFQTDPVVTTLSDGRFVVIWRSITGSSSTARIGRIFNMDGTPAGGEFVVSTTSVSTGTPSLTSLPGGGFVAGIRASTHRNLIALQAFDNSGASTGTFSPPPSTISPPNGRDLHHLDSSLSQYGNELVVAWLDVEVQHYPATQMQPDDFFNRTVRFRRINVDTNAVIDSNVVVRALNAAFTPNAPSVTHLATGEFVIVWQETYIPEGSSQSVNVVRGQLYSTSGTAVGGVFDVNMPFATSMGVKPRVARGPDGGFTVAFDYQASAGSDQDVWATGAQIFNADATPAGPGFTVNSTTKDNQIGVVPAVLTGGNLAFTFADDSRSDLAGTDFRYDVRVRVFAPIAVASSIYSLPVLANDSDPESDPLTITAVNGTQITAGAANWQIPVSAPLAGPVTLPSGAVVSLGSDLSYDPAGAGFATALPSGATGDDVFTYTISDGTGTDTATVTVTLTGMNDPPIADGESLAIPEDWPVLDVTSQLLDGDTDPDTGETALLSILAADTTGTTGVVTVSNGTLTYQPGPGFAELPQGDFAVDHFTYIIADPSGATASANVDVTVTGANDVPVAAPLFGALAEDSLPANVTPTALSSLTDPDQGDSHTVTGFSAAGTRGHVTLSGGQLVYDPRGYFPDLGDGETYDDSFTYTVTDAFGASATANVTMTVSGVSNLVTARTSGLGTGQVTSAPGGITCGNGGNDCTEVFAPASSVTLTPTPAADSAFASWTTGPCAGQTGPCTFSMGGDVTATARFVLSTPPAGRIVAATLPGARSGFVGGPDITAYLSVVSRATTPAQTCTISAPGTPPFALSYRALDGTGTPTGPLNPVFDLAEGGVASFLLILTPQTATGPGGYLFQPAISCQNADLVPIEGINSVLVSIGTVSPPDILSIAATPSADGVIRIPGSGNRINFMSAAAVNIGAGDGSAGANEATITASVDTGTATLPLTLEVCQTASTGGCITPRGETSVDVLFEPNTAKFFAVFARIAEGQGIPFDPANARIYLRFTDANDVLRSVTSVAVTSPTPSSDVAETVMAGRWSVLVRQESGDWPSLERGSLHVLGDGRAVLASGERARLIEVTVQPGADGTVIFTAGAATGTALPSGTIRLGDALSDQPGAFWGVRDARSDQAPDWTDLASLYGGITVAADGAISGSFDGCTVAGNATRSPDGAAGLRTASVTFSGCATQGSYTALLDPAANDNDAPALILANEERGWRVTR